MALTNQTYNVFSDWWFTPSTADSFRVTETYNTVKSFWNAPKLFIWLDHIKHWITTDFDLERAAWSSWCSLGCKTTGCRCATDTGQRKAQSNTTSSRWAELKVVWDRGVMTSLRKSWNFTSGADSKIWGQTLHTEVCKIIPACLKIPASVLPGNLASPCTANQPILESLSSTLGTKQG